MASLVYQVGLQGLPLPLIVRGFDKPKLQRVGYLGDGFQFPVIFPNTVRLAKPSRRVRPPRVLDGLYPLRLAPFGVPSVCRGRGLYPP